VALRRHPPPVGATHPGGRRQEYASRGRLSRVVVKPIVQFPHVSNMLGTMSGCGTIWTHPPGCRLSPEFEPTPAWEARPRASFPFLSGHRWSPSEIPLVGPYLPTGMVGRGGFEPPISCSQSRLDNRASLRPDF